MTYIALYSLKEHENPWRFNSKIGFQNIDNLMATKNHTAKSFKHYPVSTRRYLDVVSTFFERCGRQMDVETTLCA